MRDTAGWQTNKQRHAVSKLSLSLINIATYIHTNIGLLSKQLNAKDCSLMYKI